MNNIDRDYEIEIIKKRLRRVEALKSDLPVVNWSINEHTSDSALSFSYTADGDCDVLLSFTCRNATDDYSTVSVYRNGILLLKRRLTADSTVPLTLSRRFSGAGTVTIIKTGSFSIKTLALTVTGESVRKLYSERSLEYAARSDVRILAVADGTASLYDGTFTELYSVTAEKTAKIALVSDSHNEFVSVMATVSRSGVLSVLLPESDGLALTVASGVEDVCFAESNDGVYCSLFYIIGSRLMYRRLIVGDGLSLGNEYLVGGVYAPSSLFFVRGRGLLLVGVAGGSKGCEVVVTENGTALSDFFTVNVGRVTGSYHTDASTKLFVRDDYGLVSERILRNDRSVGNPNALRYADAYVQFQPSRAIVMQDGVISIESLS